MNEPYIGVTGFISKDEAESVLSTLPINSNRLLMVGVLASTTTVNGDRPSKFFGRYPEIDNIGRIFPAHNLAFNAIHFNDKTKDDNRIFEQLVTLTDKGGENFHGFQLNIRWPNPDVLNRYLGACPKAKIILQVGGGAYEAVNRDPILMAEKIRDEYNGLVNYVLIDPSGGEGREFDIQMALHCLQALRETCDPEIGFGIAGGLCYDNVGELLPPIIKQFPEVSIDAEGKLRDWNKGDSLNVERTIKYVRAANKLFGNV